MANHFPKIADLKDKLQGGSTDAVLMRGAGGTFLVKIGGIAIAFGVQILLARILGEGQYGIFTYVISWLMILILLGKLGIDTTLLRFAAAYRANEEWGLLKGVLRTGNKIAFIASISVGILVALVVFALGDHIATDLKMTFWIGCLVLPVMALVQVRQAIMRSMQKVILAVLPELIIQPALLAILVLIIMVSDRSLDAFSAMILHFTAFVGALIIISRWTNRIVSSETQEASEEIRLKEWISVMLPLLMMAGFNVINHRVDVIMVGLFKGTTDAGIYSVSVHLANFMVLGLTAVNLIAAPLISHLYAQNKKKELQRMASLSALGIAIFTVPAAIIMLFCGTWLLGLFGEGFKAGYGALVFLVAGQSVNALTGSVGYLLTMTGYQKEAAIVMGITAFINITLNVILIPVMGLKGAAIATMISTMVWKFVMYVIVRRNLKIDPSIIGLFGRRGRNEQH